MYAIVAVVISLLVLARPSEARIVYTPTNVAIKNSPYKLDLNHNGITDFTIQRFFTFAYPCMNGPWHEEALSEMPAQGSGAVVASDGCSAALDRGVEIGPNQSFNPNRDSMAYVVSGWYLARDTCFYMHGMSGDWVNVSSRYLGLKFQIKGKTHYGWARLSVQVGFVYIDATLTGYAYETIAGKSLKAGQKKEAADDPTNEDFSSGASVTNPISDPPQPASLGALAMGAPGLSIWRRKEQALPE